MESCCADDDLHPRLKLPNPIIVITSLGLVYFAVCATLSFHLSYWGLALAVVEVLVVIIVFSELAERNHPVSGFLMFLIGITSFVAAGVGILNYHGFYSPYLTAKTGRDYHDLTASSAASAHQDGGIISFNSDALLDTTRALGLRNHGQTYCVAPVMSKAAADSTGSLPPVQFWSIGTDCCGKSGEFECDDAGNATVRGGLVQHDPEELITSRIFAPHTDHDVFLQAVAAASALHELQTASPPVLVRWVANPALFLKHYLQLAWLILCGSSLIVTLVAGLAWCSMSTMVDMSVRRAAQQRGLFGNYGGAGKGAPAPVGTPPLEAGQKGKYVWKEDPHLT